MTPCFDKAERPYLAAERGSVLHGGRGDLDETNLVPACGVRDQERVAVVDASDLSGEFLERGDLGSRRDVRSAGQRALLGGVPPRLGDCGRESAGNVAKLGMGAYCA